MFHSYGIQLANEILAAMLVVRFHGEFCLGSPCARLCYAGFDSCTEKVLDVDKQKQSLLHAESLHK